ncbi:hypothetical protein BS78_04G030100 [Paspalum vaginatum]|nr:hypothetical protein BS78_04G030100 [Paspalum vaginatum]
MEDLTMEDTRSGGTKRTAKQAAAAAPESKKKTKKVLRVKQEYIDWLLARRPQPFRGMRRGELLERDESGRGDRLRALMAHGAALHNEQLDRDMAILEQYRRQGFFAEEVFEVSGAEDRLAAVGN